MAYREVTMLEIKEVLRLWLDGTPIRRIARQLGLGRNTVRGYTSAAERFGLAPGQGAGSLTEGQLAEIVAALPTAPGRPHGESWALCREHRDFIETKLRAPLRLSKVRKLLGRTGVQVPYATLHRFAVAELGFGRASPTIAVADCEPGQEVQLDTGWMTQLEPDEEGRRRRFRAWIFTAVRSRHRFVWPCLRETTETAIEACEAAWEYFGGVFRVLVPDNTKTIVQTADPLAPRLNPTFLEYAQARGFHIDPTRSRSPRDKGRVERSVQTVRDDCFAGERLRDVEQARAHARRWCTHDYGMRRHTRTQRLPLEHFTAEERPALLPAPTEPYDVPRWSEPKVARDQYAQVDKALYSLPTAYVGKKLRARADRHTVRFYDGRACVKVCPRLPPGGRHTDRNDFPADRSAYALRDVDFLQSQAASHGPAVGRFARALLGGPLPWTRMRAVYALLGLARRYGDERLDAACETALAAEMHNVRRLERMIQLGLPRPPAPPAPARPANDVPIARFLRPPSQYALPFARPQPEGEDR
jgi:transposase